MKYIGFIFFLTIGNINFSQSIYDFESDSLFIVWGSQNFSDSTDLSAEVNLVSDGDKISINVKVIDDKLVFNNDPINSDHIEIWLSLPRLLETDGFTINYDAISPSFVIGDSNLYLYKLQSNLDSLEKEIINPTVAFLSQAEDEIFPLSKADDWLQDDINEFLLDAKKSKLYKDYIFFGISHFGVLPKSKDVFQYDLEKYSYLKNRTKIELDALSDYISVKNEINDNGYNLLINISPEGFGFISKYGISKFRFLIDVIDVDDKGRQESLLSTSSTRKWGEPKSFNFIKLKKPISVKLINNISVIGKTIDYTSPNNELMQHVTNTFMKTNLGWTPIEFKSMDYFAVNRPGVYTLPNISKFNFVKKFIGYESKLVQNNLIELLNFPDGEYLLLNKKLFYPTKNIIGQILLPDSNLALLITEYSTNSWEQLTSELFLAKNDSKQLLMYYISGSKPYINFPYHKLKIEGNWDYSSLEWNPYKGGENISWTNVVKILSNGNGLRVELGNDHNYQIKWNEHGENIVFTKQE